MKHIKVLGITGGVGAGKSTVLAYLEKKYKARVIQLDQAAHLLMEPGKTCWQRITDTFGREILREDQSIDREKLGRIVFSDEEKIRILNGIVHPEVKRYICEQIELEQEKGQASFVVLEAALLLEDHYDLICDEIWYIYVEPEVRLRRLQISRGYTKEKTEAILKNQKPDEEFRKACQFVVDNSSDFIENTYEQIDEGLKKHGIM